MNKIILAMFSLKYIYKYTLKIKSLKQVNIQPLERINQLVSSKKKNPTIINHINALNIITC